MNFAFRSADEVDICHAGDDRYAVAQGVIRKVIKLFQRDIPGQGQINYGLCVDIKFENPGVFDVLRQIRLYQVEFLADVGGGDVHIHVQLELQQCLANIFHA